MFLLTTFLTLLLIGIPNDCWAWGIGFHLQVGSWLLDNVGSLAPQLQALLASRPHDYLYGCIAADITLGKKFTHYLKHCHSWRVALQLIDAAGSDGQKACAYGYLSHLAMDTVAHSFFVPYKLVRTYSTMMLKHTYWEMRMEDDLDPAVWSLAREIARKDYRENDVLLRGIIADTIFSFGTNKRIFNSLLMLNRLQHWQKMMRSMGRNSKWEIPAANREEYLDLAREVTASILRHLDTSPYWQADPAGERALYAARIIRKNLNFLHICNKLPKEEGERLVAEMRPHFREGMTCPDQLLELLSAY
ncbi:zinc dependent phospholipase C [Geothermobacter ehrlichii]|uniref:Zinc dependent phospholipase C n=1 Tax=Geothermobacter ehrlichii TaxID=213224 RepID=A0A5D3WJT4_9BACT|nr:zinc dependent phospholipase C family protein [Geothermobacter ehrlichii]TYO98827.1 zinc dependent phospholipase C [Geothermobacter ehrlichii]